jgi:flagellar motor protein MotB
MAKLFTQEKGKHIDVIDIDDLIVLFIQDDSCFPSKTSSIKLNERQTKSLFTKLKYRLKKLEGKK